VVAYLPEHNAMVIEWIAGEPLSAATLRRGTHLAAVAAACRRLHGAERFRDDFDRFERQPRYLEIVLARGFRLPERYREFEPHVAAIRAALERRAEPTVPCHNDLLAENSSFVLACETLVRAPNIAPWNSCSKRPPGRPARSPPTGPPSSCSRCSPASGRSA